jgi:rRNA maturation protein Rpf1
MPAIFTTTRKARKETIGYAAELSKSNSGARFVRRGTKSLKSLVELCRRKGFDMLMIISGVNEVREIRVSEYSWEWR